MMFSFASWVNYVPIGCRHPYTGSWQPLMAKRTATCSLGYPDNEHQLNVDSLRTCIVGKQCIAWIFACITVLLTALLGKNTVY
jgi:hypothetical protein